MRTVSRCPCCDANHVRVVASLNAHNRERFDQFDRRRYGGLLGSWLEEVEPVVVRCDRCGHCWYRHQPEPSQLAEMYASAIPLGRSKPVAAAPSGAMVGRMRRFARLVGTVGRRPRLLDFGSGTGRWSLAAAQAGFDVVAFEPNADRVAIDDPSIEQIFRWEDLEGRSFEAIQIEQVLEHVPDPHQVLRELRSLCRPGALIRISVPNVARDPDAGRLWETWPFNGQAPHVMAPYEHLHGYCARSLDALIARACLAPLPLHTELTTRPLDLLRRLLGPLLPPFSSTERFVTAAAR